MDPGKTIIIGAGPTGLSAAYHLGQESILLEQHSQVGGWCRSFEDRGFIFDYAGHILFSNDPYVLELYRILLGDNIHWQDREAWIYSKQVYTRYPFQCSFYGLSSDVIQECLVGAIEAQYGSLKRKESPFTPKEPHNFEEFIHRAWGSGIAKHFAIPYNLKLWATPLTDIEISWLKGRVPLPDLEEMIEGALKPKRKPMGPNARFGYPLTGGFQSIMNGFIPHLKGELKLNTKVVNISPSDRSITLQDGTNMNYQFLISTMPLPLLIRAIGSEAPPEIQEASSKLRHVSVRCVNIGLAREQITDKHWIYYPEESVFHRVFVQSNASPSAAPKGCSSFTCEITYSDSKQLPCDGADLIERCLVDCRKVQLIDPSDAILTVNQVDLPYAYVVYTHDRAQYVTLIRNWLAERDIFLAGRYSEWEYYNSDHAFLSGKKVADMVMNLATK